MFAVQVAIMRGKGGVFTSLFHYVRLFEASGVRSVCLYAGPAAQQLRDAGIDVIDAPRSITSPLFQFLPGFARIRGEIAARGGAPDFVMAHSDLAMPALKRMFPRAVIMTRCHSDNFKHKARADLVVTLNEDQQVRAQAALPRTRVRMFGNPFVPNVHEQGPSAEAPPRVRFNFLGRVEQVKDPLTLVKAYAAATLAPDTELRIIGAGSQEAQVRAAAAARSKNINMAGWLASPFAHFDQSDILVLPSEWESYSWVIREALHHGVPVIASDIFVHRDALGGGAYGLLFPVGDAGALREALEHAALNLPTLRAMAAKGRDDLMAAYGAKPFWAKMSAEISDIRRARGA
ncbi:MAG: glycosyltransferase family 4 protein [Hyphomonadaceae bacterium JAD_PAG50586_4]|nr:MAG: glycosyltransferase family 4 protein [Hyphomonadaceae bacterium JAD_PAG50586_4]